MGCLVPDKPPKGGRKPKKKGGVQVVQPNMECPLVQSVVSDVAAEVRRKVLRKLRRKK